MRHNPFAIDQSARNRWLELMRIAFQQTQLPPEAAAVLQGFFESTATAMINRA
jgi:hemoglobin